MSSRWDFNKEKIFIYIAEKYNFPELVTDITKLKNKVLQDYWEGKETLYLFFTDNTMIVLASDTDYDDCCNTPLLFKKVDWNLILDIRAYQAFKSGKRERDKDYQYDIWQDKAVKELEQLVQKFDKAERLRKDKIYYELLKEKFEGKK